MMLKKPTKGVRVLMIFLLQEIVDWFNSIRAIQLHYLKVAFPGATEVEVCTHTHTHIHA